MNRIERVERLLQSVEYETSLAVAESTELLSENARLNAENAKLNTENAKLRKFCAELYKEVKLAPDYFISVRRKKLYTAMADAVGIKAWMAS